MKLCRTFTFPAAHHLPYHEGKCKRPHGHTYTLEVCVEGLPQTVKGPELDMVVDFGWLDGVVKESVLSLLDHANLNDRFHNPTAEAVASWVWSVLDEMFAPELHRFSLCRVRLWETPNSYVELTEDELVEMVS